MPVINVKGKDYYVSESQFLEIKRNVKPQLEIKEFPGWEQVAVYVGNILVGYVAGKIFDRILSGKTEKQT